MPELTPQQWVDLADKLTVAGGEKLFRDTHAAGLEPVFVGAIMVGIEGASVQMSAHPMFVASEKGNAIFRTMVKEITNIVMKHAPELFRNALDEDEASEAKLS